MTHPSQAANANPEGATGFPAERVLKGVIQASPLPIVVVDAGGIVRMWNRATEELFGWSADEVIGSPLPYIDARARAEYESLLRDPFEGRVVRNVQIKRLRRDGTEMTLLLSEAPVRDDSGQVVAVVKMLQDITERQALSDALQAERDSLAKINAILRAVRSINRMLVRETQPASLAQSACDILVETGVYHTAWLAVAHGSDRLHMLGRAGRAGAVNQLAEALEMGVEVLCIRQALDSGEVFTCPNALLDDGGCRYRWAVESSAVMVAPLVYGEERFGVLSVAAEPGFLPDDVSRDLVSEIADDIGYALNGLQVAAELKLQAAEEHRYQERLQALVEVSNDLVMTQSVDELCRRAVELGRSQLGLDRLGIWLFEPGQETAGEEGGQALFRGTYGIDELGELRDERERIAALDSWDELTRRMIEDGVAKPYVRDVGPVFDDQHRIVGQGAGLRAVIRDRDEFAGFIAADNLLSGRDVTSRDGDLLALYAATLSNLLYRRRAEKVSQEREEYYRMLFETTGTATLVINDDGTIALANAEAEKLLACPPGETLQGNRAWEYVDHDDVIRIQDYQRRRALDPNSAPSSYEFRVRDTAGRVHDTIVHVGSLPQSRQTLMSILDITEQKQEAERARRRLVRQSALDAVIAEASRVDAPQVLLEVTLQHVMGALDVDMGACWMPGLDVRVGFPPALRDLIDHIAVPEGTAQAPVAIADFEVVSEPWLAPIEATMLDAGIRAALWSPIFPPEDGRAFTGLAVASAAPRDWSEHERDFVAAICRQLVSATRRRQLQDQARQQAQRLATVVDSVPEGVILLSELGEIILANPPAQALLKQFAGVEVGDTLLAFGPVPLADLLAPSPSTGWYEFNVGDMTLMSDAHPLADTYRLEGWVLLLWDATESRRTERQLQQQERLAAVGRLAAGIAHDFNNIMAVIMLYSQMVGREPGLSARSRDQVDVVYKQARRATELIEQILDFSRSVPLQRHPMDLLPYLKELIRLWERTLPESIHYDLVYDRAAHRVMADPTRLQQTLMNLATNARDAMPEGGTVGIELDLVTYDCAEVPVAEMAPGDWVRLRFSDTGTGIPEDLRQRVFEPFFTTKPAGQGTGLGLAQVYGIVKQHDGEVTLDSVVGEGTTVTVYLPALAGAADDDLGTAEAVVPLVGHGEVILVVEDSPTTRAALVETLTQLQYEVVAAANGVEALEILDMRGKDIALILSDAVMPQMGGAQLLAAMAARGDPHPVVILSGYAAPEEQADLQEMPNFVTWLKKPAELGALAEVVRRSLGGGG